MTALGLLVPGEDAEDDYPRLEQLLGSDVRIDLIRADPAGDPPERLAARTEELRLAGADSVVWASTTAAVAAGWEGAHGQVRVLARAAGLPASSTAFGFVHAARELSVSRVAVVTAHGDTAFTEFLRAGGVSVVCTAPLGENLAASVHPAAHEDAQALLLPDTDLRAVARLTALERRLGKPVLSAHQVAVWEALRLTDRRVNAPELGVLFTREPVVQV
ncbi:decarboxylase [Streptomyces niveiscabiei]|uniref:aspartate racemase/maleate isomerase family protein n=1 Tax=Streptomyces niveiscabiei TaxID=164115 RepID=UPI0029A86242|nr:decarboxylase [Streptomyces niveiscabiei]MDX3383574.1 decarboxylase [Streptomyces niveiscabiei]